MPAGERKLWPRSEKHPHVLGEVKRICLGDCQVDGLMLYETSVEREKVPAELPALRGKLIGGMDDIYCTICGAPVANWRNGEHALEALLDLIPNRR